MSEYGERIASLESSRDNHHSWISSIEKSFKDRVDRVEVRIHGMEALMNQAKGGWFLLCLLCGGSAGIGAMIVKFWK